MLAAVALALVIRFAGTIRGRPLDPLVAARATQAAGVEAFMREPISPTTYSS